MTDHSELQGAQETYVPAPTPANEKERIAALHALDILDSAEEDIYNAITQAAADACQTSMASLTFVDSARQWFKARVGLTARETARDVSFCGHAIAGHELFVVENALEDARFRHNPFRDRRAKSALLCGHAVDCGQRTFRRNIVCLGRQSAAAD